MNIIKYYMEFILLLSLLGITGCNASSQSNGQPKQIELIANGWMLTVKPDGSAEIARIKESNAIFSTASAPSGVVDFEKVKEALNLDSDSSTTPKFEVHLQAGIRVEGQDSIVLKPVRNVEIWNKLVEQLKPKWTGPMLSSFQKSVEINPLKIATP
jgi:hypothetical protein